MTSNALSLLGLALRGNNLAVGEEPVAEACKTGQAKLVLTAADAAANSAGRAGRMAELGGVPWVRVPWDKETLGNALGRRLCAVAALTDTGLAAALARKLAGTDPQYQPLADRLTAEIRPARPMKKKTARAPAKRPAAPEI